MTNDGANGYGHNAGRDYGCFKDGSTAASHITDDRSYGECVPDGYIDTGTNAYFCSQNGRNVCLFDAFGALDVKQYDDVYDGFMGEFFNLYQVDIL